MQMERLKASVEPIRQKIINHKVYTEIQDVNDLQIFMQYHVLAVWDFMSLLKILQNNLTCVSVPWFPKGSADTRFLINEIVVGEEADIDLYGNRKSHFEIYLEAMQQCGADTSRMNLFIEAFKSSRNLSYALDVANVPVAAASFVDFTFSVIGSNKDYLQAAIFTFGREDLIPGMFLSIVNDLYTRLPQGISIFKYYLERHIEVDGDHHSHLALQMTSNLCGNSVSRWEEAEKFVIKSLQKRIELWDGAYNQIIVNRALTKKHFAVAK